MRVKIFLVLYHILGLSKAEEKTLTHKNFLRWWEMQDETEKQIFVDNFSFEIISEIILYKNKTKNYQEKQL